MSFIEKVTLGLEKMETLQIRTIVGEMESIPDEKDKTKTIFRIISGKTVDGIISKIHLITGDIDTEISPKFATEYTQLREFHLLKERQAQDIVQKNINVIISVLSLFDANGQLKKVFNKTT